jgi:superfamily II RNA helicase
MSSRPAITAVFVNEKETDEGLEKKRVPKPLRKVFQQAREALAPVAAEMQAEGFEGRSLYLKPAAVLFAWAKGGPWEEVVKEAGMEEGDLAMLILRTADNLRHIRALERVFPAAAATAARALALLLREPVGER